MYEMQRERPGGDLKVSEVAQVLRVSENKVRAFIDQGELRAYSVGGSRGLRVKREDLDEFREDHRVAPSVQTR